MIHFCVLEFFAMEKRTLGWTEVEVPVICIGTMTWGQQNTEADAHEQLNYAVEERGMYFVDTAEIYPVPPEPALQGLTETYIGNWIEKRGKRHDLVIATKVAASNIVSTRDTGRTPRLDTKSIRNAIEGSLSRLKTDYVDLYQIHWPERATNFFGTRGYTHNHTEDATSIEETLTALAELVNEGKVRHIGVSNETPWGVSEYLRLARDKKLPRIATIQNQYSLVNRQFEGGLAEFSMREQVGLLPYSVLSMGVLTGKYLGGARPDGARFTFSERNSSRYNPPEVQEVTRRYVELAQKYGLDPATVAIAFATSREFTNSTIIGARTMEQLKVCINAGEVKLPTELVADIDRVHKEMPDVQV